ncbi:hypothetical protein QU24_02230 [Pantoea rodasii]|uniref:Saf-pilin pilus formation protein domain-containing protein n=1 Tax=Pantoea rodasii TaxID=1076549 RepID=A0A0B1RF37_9GAMM|nr:hypothetical protein [Pantoea rodasii]KHJ69695.1 hypothetical protein QU24_02230 [Pantoea rodasii]
MKLIKSTVIITFVTASLSALAKEPVGDMVTQSADLIFHSPGEISLLITPAKDLKAGKYANDTRVASFTVNSSVLSKLGVRFTPGSGKVESVNKVTVTGKNDTSHTLSLKLDPVDPFITTKNWIISRDELIFFTGNIHINGFHFVLPDTYTVSMDASFFAS